MKIAIIWVALWSLAGCASSPDAPRAGGGSLDAEVRRLMTRESVQGMALAVIEQGQVAHVAAYGRRNVERDLPLATDTIMYGASLTKTSRAELVRPQVPITSKHQFPSLMTETEARNAELGLAAGLGLVTFQDTSGPAWFKGGHNPWTGNMVICLEATKRCVVMLANDVRAERIYPELARKILGETRMPWRWEYDWADTTAE